MARVYVSGSIYDQPYIQNILSRVRLAGHTITHDWTAYKGPKDNYDEALRQLHGVWTAQVVVVKVHPRLKAGWMELGAAVSHNQPVIVIPHADVSPSMWYSLPCIHMIGDYSIEEAIRLVI